MSLITFKTHLISDIAKVKYKERHMGTTMLQK